jgi:hypothetical protein
VEDYEWGLALYSFNFDPLLGGVGGARLSPACMWRRCHWLGSLAIVRRNARLNCHSGLAAGC